MNRIEKKFRELKNRKEKALVIYLTAGDPSLKKNAELINAFESDGVDLIELGVPFSDPVADGPVIQEASQRAIKKKTNLRKIFGLVKRVRKRSQIPLLLMSYLNPILQYGYAHFARSARLSGVDGVIIPDLPPEEGREIAPILKRENINLVYLLAPTSTTKRIRLVSNASAGFIYFVSITGVTGIHRSVPFKLEAILGRVKKETPLPVCVGFGVSTPAQAREVSRSADGVIIGSAVVKALAAHSNANAEEFSKHRVRPFVKALGKRASWHRR